MKNTKLPVLLIICALAGCGKTPSKNSNSNNEYIYSQTESNVKTTDQAKGVEGFKDLKFGMTSADLAKLEICNKQYLRFSGIDGYEQNLRLYGEKKDLSVDAESLKIQNEINEAEKNNENKIKEYRHSLKDKKEKLEARLDALKLEPTSEINEIIQVQREVNSAEQNDENKVKEYSQSLKAEKDRLEKLQLKFAEENQRIEDNRLRITGRFELASAYSPEVTDEWAKKSYCVANIMGYDKKLYLKLIDGKLSSIFIDFGQFDDDLYHSIAKALAEKYNAYYIPGDDQVSAFNNNKLSRISTTFENNQILWIVNNDAYGKYMRLMYFDISEAKKDIPNLSIGLINSNDL